MARPVASSRPFGVVLAKDRRIIRDRRYIQGGSSKDQIRKERSFRNNLARLCHSLGGRIYQIRSWFERQTKLRIGHSLVRGVSTEIKPATPYERVS